MINNWDINLQHDENSPLRNAVVCGNISIIKLLLEKGISPVKFIEENEYQYPIQIASYRGHEEVVKLLLSDKRVNPTVNNNKSVKLASSKQNIDIVKILLDDKRVLKSININDFKKFLRKTDQIKIGEIIKRSFDINEIYKRISDRKANFLFEYWEDSIRRSENDELNAETISGKFKVKRENNIIRVSAKLKDFSEGYNKQIRGYLLINNKEMIVIFQSFPKSIVHVKI